MSATSVLVEAVSWITPLQAGDKPSIRRSQSVTTSSISVTAGLDCHESPITPSPVEDDVGENSCGQGVGGKIAAEPWMLPKRQSGHNNAIKILDYRAEFFRLVWRRGGQGVADFAWPGFRHHRPVGQAFMIVGEPVDELMAVAAEVFRRHERPCRLGGRSAGRALAPRIHEADECFWSRDRKRAGLSLTEHRDWFLCARQIIARRSVRPETAVKAQYGQ